MSTAHRPTWAPAKGGEEQGGMRIFKASLARSAKDLAGHTKLKFRQTGQNSGAELQERDFRVSEAPRAASAPANGVLMHRGSPLAPGRLRTAGCGQQPVGCGPTRALRAPDRMIGPAVPALLPNRFPNPPELL